MKTLRLAKDLELPLDVVTEKLAWLGRTGGGKTYGAMKAAELMLQAGAQVVTLDPVGVWAGLRMGEVKLPVYIFGGLRGDLPLEATAGGLLADMVVDRGISAVLDVSQFLQTEQRRFALEFATRFYQRKKSKPSAVHVFLEECQEFVPQNAMPGEQAMLGAFERLWKLGRNFGIGGSLISQRPQEINKKALNQAGTLIVFQMTGPQERKAIEGWVAAQGVDENIGELLPKLQRGQPHVWSPTFLGVSKTVAILPRVTADISSTPKVGAAADAVRELTPIDVQQLQADMAASIEKAKADDPKELRKQLAEKDREIRRLQAATSGSSTPNEKAQPEVQRVEVPVLTDDDRTRLAELAHGARAAAGTIEQYAQELRAEVARLERQVEEKLARATLPPVRVDHVRATPAPSRPRVAIPDEVPRREARLGKCETAILTVLAQYPEGCDAGKLTLLAGYRWSGGFRNSLSTLRTHGLIEGDNTGTMRITDAGLRTVGPVPPLPSGADLRAYWLQHPSLGKAERAVLDALCRHPRGLDAGALCRLTGYEYSGGFRNALSTLRTAGLLTGSNTGVMHPADVLVQG